MRLTIGDVRPLPLTCGSSRLSFDFPKIMGILNITPDSFSDGGELFFKGRVALSRVRERAEKMIDQGADILDIGGESSRPGAASVSTEEEIDRVIPVLEELSNVNAVLSVDTSKAEVAKIAVDAGCSIINDIRGFTDSRMLDVVASREVGLCIMHMQGTPQNMQDDPSYRDVLLEVKDFFEDRIKACDDRGISRNRLVLDPGFGFGKSLNHNLTLLSNLETTRAAGLPILVGLSRKSFLGLLTGKATHDRKIASAVADALAVICGANILRVHDIAGTKDAVKIALAMATERQDIENG